MKRILLLGAGRSSSSLIKYVLDNARALGWQLTVGDVSVETARKKIGSPDAGDAVLFDMNDTEGAREIIASADIVISLLPPNFHPLVALRCIEAGKHFLTASYVSDELKAFDEEVRAKGLVFLNECGLDPGIDHLSAMKVIDGIKTNGGKIVSFESFTGGLIAPETDPENPWRYKFTWNPRNVVMAGQGTAKYLHNGKSKYIAYAQLFRRVTSIRVPAYGHYEGYANRDSLKYIDTYGLEGIATMLRGTLRNEGFCSAWNVLVQLGCCDDSYKMENVLHMTHATFLDSFLPPLQECRSVEGKICVHFGLKSNSAEIKMLKWSGFFEETPVGLTDGTPARILEWILNKKWALEEGDKDQIVMWHRFRYVMQGEQKEIQASLVATGSDAVYTAMAKTVGLPLGIATKLIASDQIGRRGVMIPTTPEFYLPILKELTTLGITLNEWEVQ
ncbi:MAG: saccharopine dehydrogenase C-terminal domain-containing protein [Cyclobacteriaceae bacterium]